MKNLQKGFIVPLLIIIAILVISGGTYVYLSKKTQVIPVEQNNITSTTTQTATTAPSGSPMVGAGEHCGGFIRNAPVCSTGYHCQLVVSRPDTGGICAADVQSGSGIVK